MQYITENLVKIDFKVIEYGCLPGKNSRKKYSGHICSVIYLIQLHTIAKVWGRHMGWNVITQSGQQVDWTIIIQIHCIWTRLTIVQIEDTFLLVNNYIEIFNRYLIHIFSSLTIFNFFLENKLEMCFMNTDDEIYVLGTEA